MTPEEIREEKLRRKRLARFRFRSLIRKVAINTYWLSELEETKLGDNVKRNVAIILRRSGRKSILSIHEKRLLNTSHVFRSDEQNIKLVDIFLNLKCFSRFSPKVRARLSKVAHYLYYTRNRVILREGHYANAIYFILDGEVTTTRKKWLPIEEIWVDELLNVMGPGDMFGEVGLLENCKRVSTCITSTDVELLCVYRDDFEVILKDILQLQWDQVKLAMKRFEYFNQWTENQIRECCILSNVKQFDPLQTVYAEDKGRLNNVFFVLSGSCTILQCLKMKYTTQRKVRKYELLGINAKDETSKEFIEGLHQMADVIRKNRAYGTGDKPSRETHDKIRKSIATIHNNYIKGQQTRLRDKFCENLIFQKQNYETQFVEVGSFSPGSVFGLGEQMEHRSIVARTQVQCLLIPRYWLLQKSQNKGNIWQRTKMYLDSSIPNRQKIFEDFKSTNNWNKYKQDIVEDIHRLRPTTNLTNILDVPIVCRVDQGY